MNMKKSIKKLSAVLLAAFMVLAMAIPAFAASASDTVDIKIKGLKAGDTVTLYDITDETYSGTNFQGSALKAKFESVTPTLDLGDPSAEAINAISKVVGDSEKVAASVVTLEADGDYTYAINAGAYIAIVTPATNSDIIYNPVYLASYYDGTGTLVRKNDVNIDDKYQTATVATAKSSQPTVDKTITNEPTDEDKAHNAIIAQALGTKVNYEVTPTMPSYPANATNKTWYFHDTMDPGLTFLPESLTIKFKDGSADQSVTGTLSEGVYTFTYGGKTIATAKAFTEADGKNGYRLSFVYDNVRTFTGIKLAYSSMINEKAVIGDPANWNRIDMYYSNKPNEGNTYDNIDKEPQEGNGIVKKHDEYEVYTYRVAFKKTGEGADANGLKDAVFGIYRDQACTQLIETVTTNDAGYAASSQVGPGKYYIKEIAAPGNYKLNETVYEVEASFVKAEYTTSSEITTFTYTTDKAQAKDGDQAVQVGWLKNNVFYAMDQFTAEGDGVQKAYIKTETTTTASSFTVKEGENVSGGIALLADAIPNTTTPELPSTGGIGTYIFTIIGVAIIAIAGFLIFRRRPQND